MKKLMILIILVMCLTGCNKTSDTIEKLYDDYNSKIEETVSKTKVPIATKDLSDRKMIWNEDVDLKNIEIDDVPNGIVTNIHNLVGLCLKENVIIKNGGYFYETDLEECSNGE